MFPNIHSRPLWQPIETFDGPDGGVDSVALEDQILVIGTNDSMWIRNIQTGVSTSESNKMVRSVAINGGIIVSGSAHNKVKIWNTLGQLQKKFKEHERNVQSVAKKNDIVASASLDKTVKIWNIHKDKSLLTLRYISEFESVAINDTFVVAGARNGNAIVWDLFSGKQLYEIPHGGDVNAVAINDTMILTGSKTSGNVKVWNIHDGKLIKTLDLLKYDGVTSIAMNNDKAAIISKFGKTIILNLHNNKFCTFDVYNDDRKFTSLAMSEDLFAIGTTRAKDAVKVLLVDPQQFPLRTSD